MSEHRFSRIERLIGQTGLETLEKSLVVVAGLGAAGGYAAEALARAGVGTLRIVDFDRVRPSNMNRQLLALESTVGALKVDVARQRIAQINPGCTVEALPLFVHLDTLDSILTGTPDLVIDCIDSLTPKVELVAHTIRRAIPLVSCMGAALRTDPSLVRVGPFSDTRNCPLARQMRRRLRQRGVPTDFITVHSLELTDHLPADAVAPVPEDEPDEVDRGRRRRSLGSLPTLPGIFGLTAANTALRILLKDAFPGMRPDRS